MRSQGSRQVAYATIATTGVLGWILAIGWTLGAGTATAATGTCDIRGLLLQSPGSDSVQIQISPTGQGSCEPTSAAIYDNGNPIPGTTFPVSGNGSYGKAFPTVAGTNHITVRLDDGQVWDGGPIQPPPPRPPNAPDPSLAASLDQAQSSLSALARAQALAQALGAARSNPHAIVPEPTPPTGQTPTPSTAASVEPASSPGTGTAASLATAGSDEPGRSTPAVDGAHEDRTGGNWVGSGLLLGGLAVAAGCVWLVAKSRRTSKDRHAGGQP